MKLIEFIITSWVASIILSFLLLRSMTKDDIRSGAFELTGIGYYTFVYFITFIPFVNILFVGVTFIIHTAGKLKNMSTNRAEKIAKKALLLDTKKKGKDK